MGDLARTSAPALEPVTLSQFAQNARAVGHIDGWESESAALMLSAAVEAAEEFTARALIQQTWALTLAGFPATDRIELPYPPLSSVSSVVYYDSSNDSQTWSASNYEVRAPSGPYAGPGRIVLADGVSWPTTATREDAVVITFVCGYGSAGTDVPAKIRQAILVMASDLYKHRESDVIGASSTQATNTFESLLWPFRVWLDPAFDVRR